MKDNNQIPIRLAVTGIRATLAVALIVATNLSLTGCLTYFAVRHDPPPSGLDQIKEGLDRKTVEDLLGGAEKKDSNVYTYEYNTRERPPLWAAIFLDLYAPVVGVVYYGDFKKAEKAGKAEIRIVYGPKDTVISLNDTYVEAESDYFRWINSTNRNEKEQLLCVSANRGYAHAQAIQAVIYRYGLWNAETDDVKAYVWLKLADFEGQHNLQKVMTAWAQNMTSEQLAEAERSFREWEPESCEK
jgi:hypothetical protein